MAAINVVLTEPPGPDSCFVEVETDDGHSVRVGQWLQRKDGRWALRVTEEDLAGALGRPVEGLDELRRRVAEARGSTNR